MTPEPKRREPHNGRRRNKAEDDARDRRQFISDVRKMGKPAWITDIAERKERCGLYPLCKRPALERWRYDGAVIVWVDLCATELAELRKK